MTLRQYRILATLPCYGGQTFDRFLSSWTKLLGWADQKGIDMTLQVISNESLLPRARNMGISKLMMYSDYFTHILFLDADMGYTPYRLQRLLDANQDFVGCPGPTKWIHWDRAIDAVIHGRDLSHACLRYAVNLFEKRDIKSINGFAEVKDFGCCFCLVRTEVIKKLVELFPDTKCDHMVWANGAPLNEPTWAVFDTYVDDEGRYLECDHAFMARCRKAGYTIYADLTSDLSHSGLYHFDGDMAEQFLGRKYPGGGLHVEKTPLGNDQPEHAREKPVGPITPESHKFHITTIRREGDRFPLCFLEMSQLLQWTLQDLGYDCTRRENRLEEGRINVVFCFHEWFRKEHPLSIFNDYDVILYQGEQLAPGGRTMPDWYVEGFKRALAVWDYSPENCEIAKYYGHEFTHVPPGWHPKSCTIDFGTDGKDIDCLFIGMMNPRRQFIMELLGTMCTSVALIDSWGPERDEYIARAKVVVNIHCYMAATMELLRLAHLLSNGVAVVTEKSDTNPFGDGVEEVEYHKLIATVMRYVQNDQDRIALAQRGLASIQRISISEIVNGALAKMIHPHVEATQTSQP